MTVVVVGAGHAGVHAVATLRDLGYRAPITLVGDEDAVPYQRPPLSKHVVRRNDPGELLPLRSASFFGSADIDWRRGERVVEVERRSRRVVLESGVELPYERLVLALGSAPRRLSVPGGDVDGVCLLRSFDEACELWGRVESARAVVVVGGGFLGTEFAAAAAATGASVTVIELAPRLLSRSVSVPIADHLTARHRDRGIGLVFGESVAAFESAGGSVTGLSTSSGRRVTADLVLVAIGATPRTALAARAGLEVADAVVVDESLRTSDTDVFAIGDCAGVRRAGGGVHRLESVANATDHAAIAASVIAGASRPEARVPWFWSEQGDAMLQIAGVAGADDDAVVREPVDGGMVVLRFDGDRLTAVETVNRGRDHLAARRLLAAGVPVTRDEAADPTCDLKSLATASTGAARC